MLDSVVRSKHETPDSRSIVARRDAARLAMSPRDAGFVPQAAHQPVDTPSPGPSSEYTSVLPLGRTPHGRQGPLPRKGVSGTWRRRRRIILARSARPRWRVVKNRVEAAYRRMDLFERRSLAGKRPVPGGQTGPLEALAHDSLAVVSSIPHVIHRGWRGEVDCGDPGPPDRARQGSRAEEVMKQAYRPYAGSRTRKRDPEPATWRPCVPWWPSSSPGRPAGPRRRRLGSSRGRGFGLG